MLKKMAAASSYAAASWMLPSCFCSSPPRHLHHQYNLRSSKQPIHRLSLATSAFAPETGLALTAIFEEPANALSLPTWAIHVSSVVEWITAMVLVWEYGDKSGFTAWKGLSWGMVLPLGPALCACTWHFFYDSLSLEVLVAMQAGLTVVGNMTMCFAAFRIFKASQDASEIS